MKKGASRIAKPNITSKIVHHSPDSIHRVKRNILFWFIIAYILIVSGYTAIRSSYEIIYYLYSSNLGMIYTDTGVGAIVPLVPMSRAILSIFGLIGTVYLFARRRIGIWLCFLWAILQIPSITITFGELSKYVAMGLMALNIQVFFWGHFEFHHIPTRSDLSFNNYTYTYGGGINYVGLILAGLLLCLWFQNNESAQLFFHKVRSRAYKLLLASLKYDLMAALLTIIAAYYLTVVYPKANVELAIEQVKYIQGISFYPTGANYKEYGPKDISHFVATELEIDFRNVGHSGTTIQTIKLEIFPNSSEGVWRDLGYIVPYYPAGTKDNRIGGFYQDDLWKYIPSKQVTQKSFVPIRIESESSQRCSISFLLPYFDLMEPSGVASIGNNAGLSFKGKIVAELINGKIIESEIKSYVWPSPPFIKVDVPDSLKNVIYR